MVSVLPPYNDALSEKLMLMAELASSKLVAIISSGLSHGSRAHK